MEGRYLTPEEIKKYLKCGEYGGKGIFNAKETAFGIYCYAVAEVSLNFARERKSKFKSSIYDMSKYHELPEAEMAALTGRVEMAQDFLDTIAKTYINIGKKTVDFDCREFSEQYKDSRWLSIDTNLMPAVVYYNSLKMGLEPQINFPAGMFGDIDSLRGDLSTNFEYLTNDKFVKSVESKITKEKV